MPIRPGCNPNAPKKGVTKMVEPIQDIRAIARIKHNLADNPRNLCLFTLGINTAFRAGDLLRITYDMVADSPDTLLLKEKKTGNIRRVTLNNAAKNAIEYYITRKKFKPGDYLFTGQRGRLTVQTVNALIKGWCRDVGLTGNYGAHTMRKTWGYQQRVRFKVPIVLLTQAYGHSSVKQTLAYVCIQPEEIKDLYNNEI